MDLPSTNLNYGEKDYWESRFQKEEEYDWLGSFKDFKLELLQLIPNKQSTIMVVGCGNSTLSQDLYNEGYTNLVSSDYSQTVVDKMSKKYPNLGFEVHDITDMKQVKDCSYDIILDKGVLDAFMVNQGSVWSPEQSVIDSVGKSLKEIKRVLKKGGKYIMISFQQPHFRKRYLLACKEGSVQQTNEENNLYGWRLKTVNLQHGLGYFIYVCQL